MGILNFNIIRYHMVLLIRYCDAGMGGRVDDKMAFALF